VTTEGGVPHLVITKFLKLSDSICVVVGAVFKEGRIRIGEKVDCTYTPLETLSKFLVANDLNVLGIGPGGS